MGGASPRWFLNFYDAARAGDDDSGSDAGDGGDADEDGTDADGGPHKRPRLVAGIVSRRSHRRTRPLECITRAGELLFVPRGW